MEQELFDIRSIAELFPGYDTVTLIRCILDTSTELNITPVEVIDALKQELARTPHLDELTTQMDDLPDEKLVEIALEIPDKNLLSFCLTSRRFAAICQDDYFWELKTKRRFGVSVEKRRKTWKDEYKSRVTSFVSIKKYVVYRDGSFEERERTWDRIQEILESTPYTYDEIIDRIREMRGVPEEDEYLPNVLRIEYDEGSEESEEPLISFVEKEPEEEEYEGSNFIRSLNLKGLSEDDELMLSDLINEQIQRNDIISPDHQLRTMGITQFMSPEPIEISKMSDAGLPNVRVSQVEIWPRPKMFYTSTEGGQYDLREYPKLIKVIKKGLKNYSYTAGISDEGDRWYVGYSSILDREIGVHMYPENNTIYIAMSPRIYELKRTIIAVSGVNLKGMLNVIDKDYISEEEKKKMEDEEYEETRKRRRRRRKKRERMMKRRNKALAKARKKREKEARRKKKKRGRRK